MRRWLVSLCITCVTIAASAQDARPLFQSDGALEITLEAPWRRVLHQRGQALRHPALLTYTDAQGRLRHIEATIESRGLTRRRVCRFPPLRLRFAPGAATDTIFEGHRSLKVVTHCEHRALYQQYYVKELLAYRIYNLLTDQSFRVRPLDVIYRESAGDKPNGPHFAFLIEDLRDVARRGGLKVAREPRFAPTDFEARTLTRFMLFQYLIGNTDWDVLEGPQPDGCCHNVRVVGSDEPRTRHAIPYDFDSSGLVDAIYAAPDPRLPIRSVTERVYRGFCIHGGSLEPVRWEFLGHRAAILALVRDESRLDQRGRLDVTNYIGRFYAVLADEARFTREIREKCRR